MAAEDLTRDADNITVCPENQISIKTEGLPNQQKLSVSAKLCGSFSMVLGRHRRSARNIGGASYRAEGYINERLRRAERHGNSTWRLGKSSVKTIDEQSGTRVLKRGSDIWSELLSWLIILNYMPLDRNQWMVR